VFYFFLNFIFKKTKSINLNNPECYNTSMFYQYMFEDFFLQNIATRYC